MILYSDHWFFFVHILPPTHARKVKTNCCINICFENSTTESEYSCADPEGGRGSGHPLENHNNIGFLSCNTGPDPLKNHKATKPALNVGPSSARQRNAISSARQRNAI